MILFIPYSHYYRAGGSIMATRTTEDVQIPLGGNRRSDLLTAPASSKVCHTILSKTQLLSRKSTRSIEKTNSSTANQTFSQHPTV